MRLSTGLLVAGALLHSGAIAAEKPPLAPTEKWEVNFGDARCLATRNYGTKGAPLLLMLKEPVFGDVVQLTVVTKGTGNRFAEQLNGSISLDDGRPASVSLLVISVQETGELVFRTNISQQLFANVTTSRTLRTHAGGRLDESFQLSSMADLLKVMDDCVAKLRKDWNVPKGEQKNPNLKQDVSGTLARVFTSEDYPVDPLQRNEDGPVQFALLVDEKGKVADCSVIKTSGAAALDAQSCALVIKRARFKPAIGLDGKPAKGATAAQVDWRIGY